MNRILYAVAMALVIVLTTFSGLAPAGESGLTSATFVEKAAQDGRMEVELGQVAAARSRDDDVRAFARRMVTDHTKANAELAIIAKNAALPMPGELDEAHRRMIDELSAQAGEDFDAQYAQHMAKDHAEAVKLFRAAVGTTGIDPALAAFAERTLPTLEEHKRMADQLVARQGGAAATSAKVDAPR